MGEEGLDEVIDRLSGHDQHHNTARLLQLGHEFFDGVCALDGLALGLIGQEVVDLGDSSVEGNDIETMIRSVEDQILTHHGQANEAEVASGNIVSILSVAIVVRSSACKPPADVDPRQTLAARRRE